MTAPARRSDVLFHELCEAVDRPVIEVDELQKRYRDGTEAVKGVSFDVPGLGYKDPATGAIDGFEVDVVRAVVDKLTGGTGRIEFALVKDKDRITALQSGRVDLVASQLTIMPDRALSPAAVASSAVSSTARTRCRATDSTRSSITATRRETMSSGRRFSFRLTPRRIRTSAPSKRVNLGSVSSALMASKAATGMPSASEATASVARCA